MWLTEGAVRHAVCTNAADCKKAADGERLEWYAGAGEYCPECGEALSSSVESPEPPAASEAAPADRRSFDEPPPLTPGEETDAALAAFRARRRERTANPILPLWIVAAALVVTAAAIYGFRSMSVGRAPSKTIAVCAAPSARQLATDLMRAYAAKAAPAAPFVLTTSASNACDVRFSTAAQSPAAVVAHDGIVAVVNPLNPLPRISEAQLRALYSGRITDWSQLGGPPGAIVRLLPDPGSDEAKVLASSLLYGVKIDPRVQRAGASADVTRLVTGADSVSRRAIGIVAFSQSVAAKVVPIAYLPAPNVLSIASGVYPFTLSIAVQSDSRTSADGAGLVDFARSRDGAAIVLQNGLIPREGL